MYGSPMHKDGYACQAGPAAELPPPPPNFSLIRVGAGAGVCAAVDCGGGMEPGTAGAEAGCCDTGASVGAAAGGREFWGGGVGMRETFEAAQSASACHQRT